MFDSHILRMAQVPEDLSASCPPTAGGIKFGVPAVDDWLKGGLRCCGVHEFYAAPTPRGKTEKAAAALVLLLSARACAGELPLIWLRIADGQARSPLYAPGLVELCLDPDTILLFEPPDLEALLIAGVESARYGGFGAVVLEVAGYAPRLDLTASRRLALAAEYGRATVLLVRNGAVPVSSAAHTRWEVASAPSVALAANAPGHPVFDLKLLRQRGGCDGLHVRLEWNRDEAAFRAPLSGRPSAVSSGGTADRHRDSAA